MINEGTLGGKMISSTNLTGNVSSTGSISGKVIGGGGGSKEAVLYVEQELTDEEKAQARKNIGVADINMESEFLNHNNDEDSHSDIREELSKCIGEDVSGTVQTPYTIDQQSLEIVLQEPVTALDGAEILNCYSGDRENTGIPDIDRNIAIGFMSLAAGYATQARGNYSQSRGWWTIADGQCSVAEGLLSRTEGHFCHAEGTRTRAVQNNSHSEGDMTQATARQCHSEGASTVSSANCSHAEGYMSTSSGIASHSEGWGTVAAGQAQTAMGKYNIRDTKNYLIIGKGTGDSARSNALTVDKSGNLWAAGKLTSSGADYAELFEWIDGNPNNEDRIGMVVTLEGEKIRFANKDDDILGVVTGTAGVLGDNALYEWKDKYVTDDYGRIVYDDPVEEFVEYTDYVDPEKPETWTTAKESAGFHAYPKVNPNYDPNKEYISRENRKEWDAIGLLGKLYVNDDGSCIVGGYAVVDKNGIVMLSAERTNMCVMKRVSETVVQVLLK